MPFIARNAKFEERRIQELIEESEEARRALAEYKASYNLRKSLIQARKDENLTQKQLSQITGLTQQAISKIETGKNGITLESLFKYLNGIGYGLQIQRIR